MTNLQKFINSIYDSDTLHNNSPLMKYLEKLPKGRTPKVIITSTPHLRENWLYNLWENKS